MAIPTDELERRRQMLDVAIAKEKAAKAAAAAAPARTLLMAQAPADATDAADATAEADDDASVAPKATALMPAAQILAASRHAELTAPDPPDEAQPARTALLAQVEPAQTQPVAAPPEAEDPKQTKMMAQAPKPARKASAPQVRKTMVMGSLEAQLKDPSSLSLDEWPDPSGWDLGGDVGSLDDSLATGATLEQTPDAETVPLQDLGHQETEEMEDWDPMAQPPSGDPAEPEPIESAPQASVPAPDPAPAASAAPAPEASPELDPHRARKTVPAGAVVDAAAAGPKRRAGRPTGKRDGKSKRRGLPTANVRRHQQDELEAAPSASPQPSLLKWLVGVAVVVILVAILLGVGLLIILQ